MLPLPTFPGRAPRRKFRGRKRYFRAVLRQAERFVVDVRPEAWWNMWHYHADWPGWGNARWRYRLVHLRALAIVFRKIVDAQPSMRKPFQAWLMLHADDAGQDAVYLNSPNPYETPFPWRPEGTVWETDVADPIIAELLPGLALRVGHLTWTDEGDDGAPRARTAYVIYSPELGVPLE